MRLRCISVLTRPTDSQRGPLPSGVACQVNKAVPTAAEAPEQGRGPSGMRTSKARIGHRAGSACLRRWSVYGEPPTGVSASSSKVGAVCGNSASTDLSGWRSPMAVPTALRSEVASRHPTTVTPANSSDTSAGDQPSRPRSKENTWGVRRQTGRQAGGPHMSVAGSALRKDCNPMALPN
jgi:hypothetical protein